MKMVIISKLYRVNDNFTLLFVFTLITVAVSNSNQSSGLAFTISKGCGVVTSTRNRYIRQGKNYLVVGSSPDHQIWRLQGSTELSSSFNSQQYQLDVNQNGSFLSNSNGIDPILSDMIKRNELIVSNLQNIDCVNSSGQSGARKSTIMTSSAGIGVWRRILIKGRLPVATDFEINELWPSDSIIFGSLTKAMTDIDLPRFVGKHPETVNAVLIAMLRLLADFNAQRAINREDSTNESKEISEKDENLNSEFYSYEDGNIMLEADEKIIASLNDKELAENVLVTGFVEQWGGVVHGVQALDDLFGLNHGLLDVQDINESGGSFGLNDGIWEHTGWQVIPKLQRQLATMTELRDLMKIIGRRPTSENSDSTNKFTPRKANIYGALGAQFDPYMRTSVSGLTLSNSLSDMLPSEAVLLKGSSPALRRLFLAKKVESKLLSYQMSGWKDTPSVPRTRRLNYSTRMPSRPGGPLILCLDTSWSMSGIRETLSKAVTLACVSAAHKQRRDCQVVAFSNTNGVIETGTISANAEGIRRLLDFLSHSFIGGGTDVTGALKYAMNTIGTESMSASDLLLVTDGEIPDPPVSEVIMDELHILKQRTGMQIHGLLVGRNESKPLSKLCTTVHDFLARYETQSLTTARQHVALSKSSRINQVSYAGGPPTSTSLWAVRLPGLERSFRTKFWNTKGRFNRQGFIIRSLSETAMKYSEDELISIKRGKNMSMNAKNRFLDDDLDMESDALSATVGKSFRQEMEPSTTFNKDVEGTVTRILSAADQYVHEQMWNPEKLESEKNSKGSCWRYRDDLKAAVESVSKGLIERDEESKIVVLGMISMEHVLLLGPPGTAKSALGRRLAKLCGGYFFQRLLTKFTTPEEIFGPLSLRALENDEYRRSTEGFLPTASVAFLDEIFKANSAILNTLLTILNERKFDNGPGERQKCPIQCVVGASNELPECEELDALYDRFLLRKEVTPVSDDGIMQLLSMPATRPSGDNNDGSDISVSRNDRVFTDGLDTIVQALSSAADVVTMGLDVCGLIRDLRTYMRDQFDVDISDRRLVKASRLLKISAASNGRTRVDAIDCLLLEHIAWRLPEQRRAVRDWLWENLTPGGESPFVAVEPFRVLLDGLRSEASILLRKTSGDVTGAYGAREADLALLQSVIVEISSIYDVLEKRLEALSRHTELLRRSMDHLWLAPDEAQAVQQQLLPKSENVAGQIRKTLVGASALRNCLTDETIQPSLRLAVIEQLWDENMRPEVKFTDDELSIGMKEAKAKYDIDAFRAWKRARKKITKV